MDFLRNSLNQKQYLISNNNIRQLKMKLVTIIDKLYDNLQSILHGKN